MKIVTEDKNKALIVLEENDILEISSLCGNNEHLLIKCLNSSLHVDELTISQIKEKSLEEKEIEKMKKILTEEKNRLK